MIRESALTAARRAKHRLWTSETRSGRRAYALVDAVAARVQPFRFDALRYPAHRFLRFSEPLGQTMDVPERIFVLWTGQNSMPKIRADNLQQLRERAGVPVELITSENLDDWILEGHPLHPAYPYLSLTHRSDYLRAYLLHHHGGGYTDIKASVGSWGRQFSRLHEDREAWLAGYPEDSKGRLPRYGGNLEADLHRHFSFVMGTGAMVARPQSPLTAEWFKEMERRLDYFLPLIEKHPGGVRDEVAEYAVGWSQILADILYPLSLKYAHRIRLDKEFTLPNEKYR